jgi:hypothetical protein
MARTNQPDRNLRNEVQSQIDDLDDDTGLSLDSDIYAEEQTQAAKQTGTAPTAMRTKATPKTAAQQSTSMQHKKGNQPPNR